MAPTKLLGLLLLLFVCLKYVHSGKSKKTIKIHVPYYVKHIHHYKKVYVPKVQVIKHEHLHKKEHEHHHHHDHGHYYRHGHGYDKSSNGGFNEDYDSYYDDIDHRSYDNANINKRYPQNRDKIAYRTGARDAWKDQSSSEELNSSEEDDYITDDRGSDDEGTLPAPQPYRTRPKALASKTFKRVVRSKPTVGSTLYLNPTSTLLPKRVLGRITT